MTHKACMKCGEWLPLSGFYAHSRMADGRLNKCKACTKRDVSANREARKEQYQAYERRRAQLPHRIEARKAYAQSEAGKAASRKASRAGAERWPEKRRARVITGNAIRNGRLVKQPCERCGSLDVEAHHDDYSQPLAVRWLCNTHHREEHQHA